MPRCAQQRQAFFTLITLSRCTSSPRIEISSIQSCMTAPLAHLQSAPPGAAHAEAASRHRRDPPRRCGHPLSRHITLPRRRCNLHHAAGRPNASSAPTAAQPLTLTSLGSLHRHSSSQRLFAHTDDMDCSSREEMESSQAQRETTLALRASLTVSGSRALPQGLAVDTTRRANSPPCSMASPTDSRRCSTRL